MKIFSKRFKAILHISLVLIFIAPFTASIANQGEMVFGVLTDGKPAYYKAYWQKLVEQVALESGQRIRFETASSAEEFEEKLSNGTFDFVLLNAHLYTQAHDAMGYQAFAKEKGQKDKGVIVVHQDSDIQNLAQLKRKTLAISDPRRFTSTVYTQAKLNKEGIPVDLDFMDDDKSVYHAVVHKEAVAGAGEVSTLNSINPNANSKLRVIWSSKQYSSNAFAAHPRVSNDQIARVQEALLSLNSDAKGKRILGNLKFKGIDSASDNEWNDVRELKRHLSR